MKRLLSVICIILAVTAVMPFISAVMIRRTESTSAPTSDPELIVNANRITLPATENDAADDDDDELLWWDTDDGETYLFPYIDPAYTVTNGEEADEPDEETGITTDTTDTTDRATDKAGDTTTDKASDTTERPTEVVTTEKDEPQTDTIDGDSMSVRVYLHSEKKYATMTLEEYIIGVILAEMPTYFELEAFKAQAVASRTYTVYKMLTDTSYHSSYHGSTGADICTNSGHCQAYTSYERLRSKWGKETADKAYDMAKRAVEETKGLVMTYDDEVIFSPYHACSYKYTESGKNAWGLKNTPYLVTVSSPEAELDIVYSTTKISMSKFKRKISAERKNADFSDLPEKWVGKFTYNESGRVDTVIVCGEEFSGRELQSVLGLRGSNFKISYDGESETFTVKSYGWGHGVGMSQYGANEMAKDGARYDKILTHYYSGVKIEACDYL